MAKKEKSKRPKVADISSKRLIDLMPTEWLRWVTKLSNIQVREMVDADFQWISRHSDALVKAYTVEQGEFLVLIEVQLRVDEQMPRRMDAYIGLARQKYGLQVYPVLINILPPSQRSDMQTSLKRPFWAKKRFKSMK